MISSREFWVDGIFVWINTILIFIAFICIPIISYGESGLNNPHADTQIHRGGMPIKYSELGTGYTSKGVYRKGKIGQDLVIYFTYKAPLNDRYYKAKSIPFKTDFTNYWRIKLDINKWIKLGPKSSSNSYFKPITNDSYPLILMNKITHGYESLSHFEISYYNLAGKKLGTVKTSGNHVHIPKSKSYFFVVSGFSPHQSKAVLTHIKLLPNINSPKIIGHKIKPGFREIKFKNGKTIIVYPGSNNIVLNREGKIKE